MSTYILAYLRMPTHDFRTPETQVSRLHIGKKEIPGKYLSIIGKMEREYAKILPGNVLLEHYCLFTASITSIKIINYL